MCTKYDPNTVPLICSECGVGNYFLSDAFSVYATCTNVACGHSVNVVRDLYFGEGESLNLPDRGLVTLTTGGGQ